MAQSKDDAQALAEERRLLYVGSTRARTHLRLSWARERDGTSGRVGRRTVSRFLLDIGASVPVTSSSRSGTQGSAIALPVEVGPGDEGLLEALKAWRRDIARRDSVPAYVVANDATLAGVAAARPRSPSALLGVSGIGPAKLEHYGEDILRIVSAAD